MPTRNFDVVILGGGNAGMGFTVATREAHAGRSPAESGGDDMRFQPSLQPSLGLAPELSGYPDKALMSLPRRAGV